MKIKITQHMQLADFNNGWTTISKTFNSNVIPHKGDMLTDTFWKDPYEYEVTEVVISYQFDECYVSVKPLVIRSNKRDVLIKYIEKAKLAGWESSLEI
ncbi:MAG TPA: hypothetical protein PLL17_09950 [Defluviitaleaceae bacterium]|nr:hypothetical protein [Candidatus Epulonipiscium sp.]HOQ17303.1 hypothetical protein [Defluviitaleaceae bacterium]HPT76344.1 hypothetical protein [Defluviitaleaceae bacterium]HQD51433.1 hypothetical protein [Defluviitaleaceae bacterium]